MDAIRREFELSRISAEREHDLNRAEQRETRAVLGNLRDVGRSLAVAVDENTRTLRELRAEMRDQRAEIRAQTAGLMHVLDELRRLGPGGEPATS